ncbi:protein FAM171B [Lepisosteus oculatus]|uniref:protein FAM171B n=1 Tax=Lepisosteus oculatus TaxID=7918 RepID=UPI0035F522B5
MRRERWDSVLQAPFYFSSYVSFSLLSFAMSELPAYLFLSALLIFSKDGLMERVEGARTAGGPAELVDDNVNSIIQEASSNEQRHHQHQHQVQMASVSTSVSNFMLKVQVNDIVSRQYLSQAGVEVFVNHTRTNSAVTEENGVVLLKVPYKLGQTLTIVASMDGYILTPLPWKTTKMPVFSSVTLSLFPQNQGNIWLFEDSVLITGKLSDTMSQPNVQFPKNILKLPGNSNISTVTAYLTVPQLPSEKDCFLYTVGILINKSGYKNIELNPLAAISIQLFSTGKEIQVTGPIQITLPLPDSNRMRPLDAVPAWAFDMKTGAWVNRGLGLVKKEDNRLVWTYVAPHLGYWIAAPLPAARGFIGHATTMDFISYHTYLLMAILGGTLVIVFGFLTVLLCYCRGSSYEPPKKKRNITKMEVLKKDQTTSTINGNRDVYFKASGRQDDKSHSLTPRTGAQREDSAASKQKGSFNIYVEDVGLPSGKQFENVGNSGSETSRHPQQPIYVNSAEAVRSKEMAEHKRVHLALSENMFFPERLVHIYNQPVAILQAPELFHTSEHLAACKSATLPRKGQVVYDTMMEPMSKDSYTQTLPKMPLLSHLQQEPSEEQQVLEGPQSSASNPGTWGRYSSLLESVSVPGTLNEAVGMGPFCSELQGISEQTLLELSKGKPSPHPRAWFVSLEGKPVAQVRHSFIDLQKKRKPADSNDTSLDSGVDMNEHQSNKKFEREKTFIKGMPHSKILYTEDLDLSSSESGTTAACTPEDPSLRNILDSGSGPIGESQAEKEQTEVPSVQDESETRSTPPPRRLRKVRDKGKSDSKKSTWQIREERPLMSLN